MREVEMREESGVVCIEMLFCCSVSMVFTTFAPLWHWLCFWCVPMPLLVVSCVSLLGVALEAFARL